MFCLRSLFVYTYTTHNPFQSSISHKTNLSVVKSTAFHNSFTTLFNFHHILYKFSLWPKYILLLCPPTFKQFLGEKVLPISSGQVHRPKYKWCTEEESDPSVLLISYPPPKPPLLLKIYSIRRTIYNK